MGKGKPKGYKAARNLRALRNKTFWKQKDERKKVQLSYITNPFYKSGYAEGIVIEKGACLKKNRRRSNWGRHHLVRAQLIGSGKKIWAAVPHDCGLQYIDENDTVLMAKVRKGKNIGDYSEGIKYKVLKVQGICLKALAQEKKEKPRR
jgi:ribosomal protein S12